MTGAQIIVIADKDKAGRAHAEDVGGRLKGDPDMPFQTANQIGKATWRHSQELSQKRDSRRQSVTKSVTIRHPDRRIGNKYARNKGHTGVCRLIAYQQARRANNGRQ